MQENLLYSKAKQFALKIIKICNFLIEQKEYVLSNQLLRAGTSIGANISESLYAQSKADFISKLSIALKECAESEYWLELLKDSNFYSDSEVNNDCIELKKILTASINTAKQNN